MSYYSVFIRVYLLTIIVPLLISSVRTMIQLTDKRQRRYMRPFESGREREWEDVVACHLALIQTNNVIEHRR